MEIKVPPAMYARWFVEDVKALLADGNKGDPDEMLTDLVETLDEDREFKDEVIREIGRLR